MELEKMFITNTIKYKILDEDDDFKLFKINEKQLLLYLARRGTDFVLDRDIFEYLDGSKLRYSMIMEDITTNKVYFMKFSDKNNWIKRSFNTCDKQVIHLGKQILNYKISNQDLLDNLMNIK